MRALCVVELLMFVLLTCCVFFTCVFLFLVVGLDCLVCVCLCVGVPTLPTLVSVSQSVSQSVVLLLHPSLCLRLRLLLCFPLTCLSLVLSFDLLIAFVVHHAICVSSPPVDD